MEKMSHKKVHSQGNIPFSWEDSPGISKSSKVIIHYDHHHYCPIDVGSSKISVHDKKVPPPPPFSKQPLPKSSSVKGWRWWPQDPFLAAYKECTKNGGKDKLSSENGASKFLKKKKKKVSFSCRESSDVSDDYLVRLSNLPPLPKHGTRRGPKFVYPLQEYFLNT